MATPSDYPKPLRENLTRLVHALSTDCETAYAMLLMTAVLTDLSPDDRRTADTVLKDCGLEEPHVDPC